MSSHPAELHAARIQVPEEWDQLGDAGCDDADTLDKLGRDAGSPGIPCWIGGFGGIIYRHNPGDDGAGYAGYVRVHRVKVRDEDDRKIYTRRKKKTAIRVAFLWRFVWIPTMILMAWATIAKSVTILETPR